MFLFKQQVGGNQKARIFFESQSDWDDNMSIQQKYNTKAAALYRDNILTLANGKEWSSKTSSAQNYSSNLLHSSNISSSSDGGNNNTGSRSLTNSKSSGSIKYNTYQDCTNNNYDGYQNFNSQEFREQKNEFFNKKQEENATRPEYVNKFF